MSVNPTSSNQGLSSPQPSQMVKSEESTNESILNALKAIQQSGLELRMAQKKLRKQEVFASMKSIVCHVKAHSESGCGFFLNQQGLIATAFHTVEKVFFIRNTQNNKSGITLVDVSVEYKDKNYKVCFPCPPYPHSIMLNENEKSFYFKNSLDNLEKPLEKPLEELNEILNSYLNLLAKLDIILLQLDLNINEKSIFNSCFFNIGYFENVNFIEGTNVYLAGFPFAQSLLFLHKGYISTCFKDNKEVLKFGIDGEVCTGFSGGPVVIQKESTLYVIGIILEQFYRGKDLKNDEIKPVYDKLSMFLSEVVIGWINEFREAIEEHYKKDLKEKYIGMGIASYAKNIEELFNKPLIQ